MVDSNILIEKNILLVNEPDNFILTKLSSTGKEAILIQKSISPTIKSIPYDTKYEKLGTPIDGILGFIDAKETNYLMVIDRSILIGTIMGHKVFKIDSVQFIPYSSNHTLIKTSKSKYSYCKDDEKLIEQIRCFLNRNTLYFSNTLDLSISMMQLAKNVGTEKPKFNDSTLFRNSQLNFIWNFKNTRIFDNELLTNIIHPVVNGYIGIRTDQTYESEFNFCVISRKDTRRSGCRFIVRGADSNGYVANFAETEEFIVINSKENSNEYTVLSYLQIRGSIPVVWSQLPTLQLNPLIVPCNDYSMHSNAFNRHITQLRSSYDRVTLVNLVDKKGDQNVIGEYYQSLYQNSKSLFQNVSSSGLESVVDYTWFDFHQECKKMKYQNIEKLLKSQSVSASLAYHDFTHIKIRKDSINSITTGLKVVSIQKGVFRTNCIDNLDRTNVIQSVFGRQFLHKMLFRIELAEMPQGKPFEDFLPGFESKFKLLWSENGDYLSKAYSGTNALKRDFTRTGKRTIMGAIEDGVNSCTRFYINNFCDGYNQDCHDYYLGLLNPKKKNFRAHSTTFVNVLFFAVLLSSILFYNMSVSISFPEGHETNFRKGILKVFIFAGVFLCSAISMFNGFKNSIIDLSTISYH